MGMQNLSYIGNKFSLLKWITNCILQETGWNSFNDKYIGDLFSGSASVTFQLRTLGARVLSNDTELFSAVLSGAAACGVYTEQVAEIIAKLNQELEEGGAVVGYITRNYSPVGGRKYWTEVNAKRIDFLRQRIEQEYAGSEHYEFLLASLLQSADKVANCPAVYTSFFKEFQRTAERLLVLTPIHQESQAAHPKSNVRHVDVLKLELPSNLDAVYLDPPYNHRQYSKHYFPLNVVAMSPEKQEMLGVAKGKTGIPPNCYLSPFSSRTARVQTKALKALLDKVAKDSSISWLFLSFSNQSTMSKAQVRALLEGYGQVVHVYRTEQRRYHAKHGGGCVVEYLFCLRVEQETPTGK